MPVKALTLGATRKYQSIYDPDRGTDDATTWLIGTLDSRTSGRIKDLATRFIVDPNAADEEVATSINQSVVNFARVQYGLKGFDNFIHPETGDEIAYKTVSRRHDGQSYAIVDPEVMKVIPEDVITELAGEIAKGNELTPVQVKNSDTP